MSTNLSKQKRETLLNHIEEIRTFLNKSLNDENARNLAGYLNELTSEINGQKYGLVFEEHKEAIDEKLENNLSVLTEEKDLFVGNGGEMNFLLEGDNLASLQLLEKTHKGKIDVIYIDPPYNTGNKDFIYDDDFVDSADSFRHSKWLSFMEKRLRIARELQSEKGVIFISIDDNEQADLKLLCDEVFGEINFIGQIIQNKQNAKNDTINIQKNHEYILCYRKKVTVEKSKIIASLIDEKIIYKSIFMEDARYYYLNDAITTRGEGGTLNARPNLGYTVYYNPETKDKIGVADYDTTLAKTSNKEESIYVDNIDLISKGYVKIRPPKVRGKLGCWTWEINKFNSQKDDIVITGKPNSYAVHKRTFVKSDEVVEIDGKLQYCAVVKTNVKSILDFSTNDGTNVLTDIFGKSGLFNNPKNLDMIEYFIKIATSNTSTTILDFFAGSGTTGHAVLKLNAEDGGHRRFILCTNNENSICRDITYERLKTVITGKRKDGSKYSDGLPGSLKYFKVDFVEITEKEYYEYADKLLLHVRELVELENAVDFEHDKAVAIVLTEEELEEFCKKIVVEKPPVVVYLGHDVLLSKAQKELLKQKEISVKIIPQYYYPELNG